MTISSLGNKFTVNQVDFTTDASTRINIKKRRENLIYKTLSNEDNVNITYLMSNEVAPGTNLFISDRSTSLPQNRIPSATDYTVQTTKSITTSTEKFLVTDQFTTETPSQPEVPLFYVHTLENFNSSVTNFSNMTLLSIEFANENLTVKEFSEYVLDSSTGELFNNIENEYNDVSNTFSITFVKYTVKEVSGSTQTVTVYHELISNVPVYTLASFEDIDEWLLLLTTVKKYQIETNPGGASFTVTLPTTQRYAYKETPGSRLRVLEPTALDISNPWYARISNGSFIASLQKTATTSIPHKYYVAEFNSQLFSPYPPYKIEVEQRADWITESVVHVPKNIVVDGSLGLYMDVVVKDFDRVLRYAYSNDPDKIGTKYEGTTYYTDGISSFDQLNGFIELANKVLDDDIVTVSYYTEQDEYEFNFIDFNPVNNVDILNKRIVIYTAPESVRTGELENTLHYLKVNTLGEIEYASQTDGAGAISDVATSKMLSEDFFTTGFPKYTIYYDKESTASGLSSRVSSGINAGHESDFSFIDKYTVESVLLNSPNLPSGIAITNYEDNPRFLVLADMYVGENQSAPGLTDFDIRVEGGGIKDADRWNALKQQPEVAWYWDFNATRPYPGAGAFMVEVPQTLLDDHGGSFTNKDIEDIVQRHMGMGGYALVKTYGTDPSVTDVTVGSGTFQAEWPSYGSNVTYNIYYSTEINTGFMKSNTIDISDNGSGNSYTISGLNPSTKYFVKVGAVDTDEDESFGTTVSATTSTAVS